MKMKIHQFIIAAVVAFVGSTMLLTGGCRTVTVENHSEQVALDADNKPIILPNGQVQTIENWWEVSYKQHWMTVAIDSLEAFIKPDDIRFALGKVKSEPSKELGVVISKSMSGLTKLTTAIGEAYVKIAGGGAQADTALSTAAKVADYYKTAGGNVDSATVTADESAKTLQVTDGKTCISCDANGNCSDCSPSK